VTVRDAAQQAWPPFVLVCGLLLIGLAAHGDGLFERAGTLLERVAGPPVALLAAGVVLVTGVTAVLNLDTAVVFLTPVLVLAARARDIDEQPFLYASVFVANASSLYLPGFQPDQPARAGPRADVRRDVRRAPARTGGGRDRRDVDRRVAAVSRPAQGTRPRDDDDDVAARAPRAVNNLPATVLLSAQTMPHPRALLIGLNLGPNLAVTGSLTAYLWFRAARQVDARPSIVAFSRRGVVLAPVAIAAALVASSVLQTPR